ncbi:MAG: glutamate--tRNA ligase [Candidatus Nezhaarchaeales archaeon]
MLKYALKNAIDHNGRADVNAVIRKLVSEKPDVKGVIKEIIPLVRGVVEEVNALTISEQKRLFEEKFPEGLEERKGEEERKLPPLPDVERFKSVITRFAPEPNGYLHLGHAKAAILSYEYAKLYGGRFLLRFEDTNPRAEKLEYYEAIREDLKALGLSWAEEKIVSYDIPKIYSYAKEIITRGYAYACVCQTKLLRLNRRLGKECLCRSKGVEYNLQVLDKMINGAYREGEAVIRLKTSMRHKNYAMRDPVILRVVDHPHPLQGVKYHVYPTYDFACALEDCLMEVSHVLRSMEFVPRVDIQVEVCKILGFTPPVAIQFGRLKMEGTPLSKRRIIPLIREGIVKGWDDPRLATLRGLFKRGVHPDAVKRLIMDVGPSKANALITKKLLDSYNRKVVDPIANRFFFVKDPVLMRIHNAPPRRSVRIPLHPSFPERGFRVLELEGREGVMEVYVSNDDLVKRTEGSMLRLMGLFNVRLLNLNRPLEAVYAGEELIDPKIQWLPVNGGIQAEVFLIGPLLKDGRINPDSLKVVSGLVERSCAELKEGELVQFERFGFARIEKAGVDGVKAVLTHK